MELVMVFDNSIYKRFRRNSKKIHNVGQEIVKRMNLIYKPLNIFIALVGIDIWKDDDQVINKNERSKAVCSY